MSIYDEDEPVNHGNAAEDEYRRIQGMARQNDDDSEESVADREYARMQGIDGAGGDTGPSAASRAGSLFREYGEPAAKRFALSKLKSKVLGWGVKVHLLIAAGVVAGVLLVLAFFGLGTMQAVHLAQILALDQTSNVHYSNIRTTRMFWYVKSGGQQGQTRVGLLGGTIYAKTIADLKAVGVTFNTNENLGVFRGGADIDTRKLPATKGLPKERVPAKLASIYGVAEADIVMRGNTAYIEGLGTKASRVLIKNSVAQVSPEKVFNVKTRQVWKFYGIPTMLHPFRVVDYKISKAIDTREQAIKAERERQGKIANKTAERAQAYQGFKDATTGARAFADASLLIVGATCLARSAADEAITYNREAIVEPAAFAAADAQAVAAQQMAGVDFVPEQLSSYNRSMNDGEGRSVFEARGLHAKTDPRTQKGEVMPERYEQAFSSSGGAAKLRDAGGKAGELACSGPGQVTQLVLGGILTGLALPTSGGTAFAYGALKAAGGAAASVGVMMALHDLISDSLEDNPIPDDVAAPIRGNVLAYGSRELANINAISSGGVELSEQESNGIDGRNAQLNLEEFQSRPLYAQLFDVNDYRSASGRIIDQAGTPKQAARQFAVSFRNIGSTLGSMFSGLMPKAQAAAPYDWGFNRYGIPESILNNPAYADPYENADKVAALLNTEQGGDYIDKAKKCFGTTIAKDGEGLWGVLAEKEVNPLSREYEDANCADKNDSNWDRIILFVHDTSDMEAAACYLGEEESCGRLGASGGATNGSAADTGTPTPGGVDMKDDYAGECGDYTGCSGQCVDFVKFRLKKHIDKNKFDDFTTGTGGVAAYTSSDNLGEQYGYEVNNIPAVNSVVSWPAGGVAGSGANDTYGHVAMVSKVNADGSIVVEEYNATSPPETYGTRVIPAAAAKLLKYAHTEVDYR